MHSIQHFDSLVFPSSYRLNFSPKVTLRHSNFPLVTVIIPIH
jgi:hypothetical protein